MIVVAALSAALAGSVAGVAPAQAAEVSKVEPNNSLSQAQSLDGAFDTSPNAEIGRLIPGATVTTGEWVDTSTTLPHATVIATGDGTLDFYSFTVPADAGTTPYVAIVDVDHGYPADYYGLQSLVTVYDSGGVELASSRGTEPYDPGSLPVYYGSTYSTDTYLQYPVPGPGTYTVRVARAYGDPTGGPIPSWASYQLHISLGPVVDDTTPPRLYVPEGMTWEATGPDGATVTVFVPDPTARDDWFGDLPVTCDPATGSVFPLGTTEVGCSATDGAGNAATGFFNVAVQDTSPPVISPVPEVDLESGTLGAVATGPAGAVVTWTQPIASDLVDGAVTVVGTHAPGSLFPLGETDVFFTATDSHGNTSGSYFTVQVGDPPPVLTLPADMTVATGGPDGAVVTFAASASDPVDGSVTVLCDPASGSTFPLGPTTVECSATDSVAQTTTGSFTVTVVRDTTAPTVVLSVDPGPVPTANVVATFSEPVEGVTGSTFFLTKRNSLVAAQVSNPSADGRTWVLNPTKGLVKGTTYTATITTGVTDRAGNPIANAPVTWSFTVAKR